MSNTRTFQSIGQVLKKFNPTQDKYISKEFQAYGYYLAEELGDLSHKSLYIRLAKQVPRGFLEETMTFVKSCRPRSRARLFMWKLKELRKETKKNDPDSKNIAVK